MTDRFVLGVPFGRWQTNCWIVGDRARGSAVVVDPGEDAADHVPGLLRDAGVACEAILLTHGHIDHLWSVPSLARDLDVPVLLHPDDRWLWENPGATMGVEPQQLADAFGLDWDPPDDRLRDVRGGAKLSLAGIRFDVAHNPGHTPGHVTYLGRELASTPVSFALGGADVASDDVLFSGDLLFAGSIGRTDLPRGSSEAILRSLVASVLSLRDDTLVLCGHGPDTTVGTERRSNPFLQQAAAAHPPGSPGDPNRAG